MAHYAFLDSDNIVTEVITGVDENETIDGLTPEQFYSAFRNQVCLRTSYHGNVRGNYAGIGYSYLPDFDLFMPPKCHSEAILDTESAKWECVNEDHNVKLFG